MRLAELVNRALAKADLAIVRRSTLAVLEASAQSGIANEPFLSEPVPSLVEPSETITDPILAPVAQDLTSGDDRSMHAMESSLLRHQITAKWNIIDWTTPDDPSLSSMVCPLCHSTVRNGSARVFSTSCIFGGGRLERIQCDRCDLIFGPQKMLNLSAAELASEYNWHFRAFTESYSPVEELRAFAVLDPKVGGRYLNYGCGGDLDGLRTLRAQGWDVRGFEPSERQVNDPDVVFHRREQLTFERFDGIYSNNVLEHFRDPAGELTFMASLLTPESRMAHATPCFEYQYEFTRFHLAFYVGRSRHVLAEKAGFRISDFMSDGEFRCALFSRIGDRESTTQTGEQRKVERC